jgi:hypothetical protein
MSLRFTIPILGLLQVFAMTSCNSSYNPRNSSGFKPEEMTDEDLAWTYGLEAPDTIYIGLVERFEKSDFKLAEHICPRVELENTVSPYVGVWVIAEGGIITDASVKPSDFSNMLNKMIEKQLIKVALPIEVTDGRSSGDFQFRINVDKLCEFRN